MPLRARLRRFETYEVYYEVCDEQGNAVGQVTLPRNPEPFGAEKGTIYLKRQPPQSGENSGRAA